eukprot:scaffold15268_cov55-Attheya_sp.AAC.2
MWEPERDKVVPNRSPQHQGRLEIVVMSIYDECTAAIVVYDWRRGTSKISKLAEADATLLLPASCYQQAQIEPR